MASLFGFVKAFTKGQFGNVGDAIMQKIVSFDPETASQAEIDTMIEDLDKVTVEAGKAKGEWEKDQKVAKAAQDNYDRQMKAADILTQQQDAANAGSDTAKAADLEKSLTKLIGDLEKIKPEVDRTALEAKESEDFYNQLKEMAEAMADKLKNARENLGQAQRDMKRAQMEEQRAAERAAQAEKLAGLKSTSSDKGGIAIAAMNRAAEDARAKAEANKMKADLLGKGETTEDANIAAAMKEASGGGAPTMTAAERLAALKNK
jgi:hypothetical protein